MKHVTVAIVLMTFFASCQSYKEVGSGKLKYEIESVTVDKSPCFGACPMYKLTVTKEGIANLDAQNFLKNKLKGTYSTKLTEKSTMGLLKELEALDFPKLADRYGNNQITDLPATDLEIRYNRNAVKKIHDYGNNGTAALTKFYLYVDSLIYAQQWERVE